MRTEAPPQPGYFESFVRHTGSYLQQAVTQFIDDTIERSPRVVQAMIRQNKKLVQEWYKYFSESEVVERGSRWVGKNSQEIVVHGKQIAGAIAPFAHDLVDNPKAPTVGSDFGYLIKNDVLPVVSTLASGAILLAGVRSLESSLDAYFIYGLYAAWIATTAVLFVDYVIPYSLLFLVHTGVMGIFYRQQFDEATKNTRLIDAECCEKKKCTALRKVKGEVRDILGYAVQGVYLFLMGLGVTALEWVSANNAPMRTVVHLCQSLLFLLNSLHLGQSVLVMRYASDGVCQRERFESVNNQIKFVTLLGLMQTVGVWMLQQTIRPLAVVPTMMLNSFFYLMMLGVVHYMREVPRPSEETTQSALLKLIPTNAVYPAVGDIIDRVIESFKQKCLTPLELDSKKEWKSWEGFGQALYSLLKEAYYEKRNWVVKKTIAFVIRYGKYVLRPELNNFDRFLADPIFKKYWPDLFMQMSQVLEAIIMYHMVASNAATVVSVINDVKSRIGSVPGLSKAISVLARVFFGVSGEVLTPEFILSLSEDGTDSVIHAIEAIGEYLGASADKTATLRLARDNIQKFRAYRQLSFKALEALNPYLDVLAHNLKNANFMRDVRKLNYFLHAQMLRYRVGPYENVAFDSSDLVLIDKNMRARMELSQLILAEVLPENPAITDFIYTAFDERDSLIHTEHVTFQASILECMRRINAMSSADDDEVSSESVIALGPTIRDLRDSFSRDPLLGDYYKTYTDEFLYRYEEIQYKEFVARKNLFAQFTLKMHQVLQQGEEGRLRQEAAELLDSLSSEAGKKRQAQRLLKIIPTMKEDASEYFSERHEIMLTELSWRQEIMEKFASEFKEVIVGGFRQKAEEAFGEMVRSFYGSCAQYQSGNVRAPNALQYFDGLAGILQRSMQSVKNDVDFISMREKIISEELLSRRNLMNQLQRKTALDLSDTRGDKLRQELKALLDRLQMDSQEVMTQITDIVDIAVSVGQESRLSKRDIFAELEKTLSECLDKHIAIMREEVYAREALIVQYRVKRPNAVRNDFSPEQSEERQRMPSDMVLRGMVSETLGGLQVKLHAQAEMLKRAENSVSTQTDVVMSSRLNEKLRENLVPALLAYRERLQQYFFKSGQIYIEEFLARQGMLAEFAAGPREATPDATTSVVSGEVSGIMRAPASGLPRFFSAAPDQDLQSQSAAQWSTAVLRDEKEGSDWEEVDEDFGFDVVRGDDISRNGHTATSRVLSQAEGGVAAPTSYFY